MGRHTVIGIVVVSHSRPLAEAAVAFASQMVATREGPRVAVAAGLDSPEGPLLGTDADAIARAITEADSPGGVLVLMDLGSSVMGAQMALEFLDPDLAARVRLSPAPLVEGLVTAVVAAAAGLTLEGVAARARASLADKEAHLGDNPASTPEAMPDQAGDQAGERAGERAGSEEGGEAAREAPERAGGGADLARVVLVTATTGLHLRPAALMAGLVGSFDAEVTARNEDTGRGPVAADSLTELLALGAEHGHRLRLVARGPQAQAVLDAVADLAEGDFEPPADR
ncbi:MAG: HPr family phosphocarrier protein [Actinomycetes bacterium]